MTVYVDDFRAPARAGRVSGRWSHLTADTRTELALFAAGIGLHPDWFQMRCKVPSCEPCPHWHYDVTDAKRQAAIAAGAEPIGIREMGALIRARRERSRPSTDHEENRSAFRTEPTRED